MKFVAKELYTAVEGAFKRSVLAILRLTLESRKFDKKLRPVDVRRILFLRYDRIGDMITTLPTFAIAKAINPAMEVDVLASTSNELIARFDQHVDNVFVLPKGLWRLYTLLRVLRRKQYDVVVACIFGKSTIVGLLSVLIGGRKSVRATLDRGPKYDVLFTVQSKSARTRDSAFERVSFILPDVFDTDLDPLFFRPTLSIPPLSLSRATEQVENMHLQSKDFVLINISCRNQRNEWTDSGFATLIDWLHDTLTLPVLLTCLPYDIHRAEMLSESRDWTHVYPQTSDIMEIAALIRHSLMVISPDTGVIHMCSAQNVPVVGLYIGSERGMNEWGPYRIDHCAIVASNNEQEHVHTIEADRVIAAVNQVFDSLRRAERH